MVPIIFSEKSSLLGLGKGYITKEALDTRWCHYQTLAPIQEDEKPAPEVENDKEKSRNGHATPPGNTGTAAADRTYDEEAIEDAGKYGKRVGAWFPPPV
jgi:hypothetical protein